MDAIEAVGGTKNPDVARIVAPAPDLVLVNEEENRLDDYRPLEAAGLRVHVANPSTVAEAVAMLEQLGEVCGAAAEGRSLAARCREALAACDEAMAGRKPVPTICPSGDVE